MIFAIRGATQIDSDTSDAIAVAVTELCAAIEAANDLRRGDIVSAIFTLTADLRAAFPAASARAFGWNDVPMMCAQEVDVPGAMPRVCRVMVHVRGEARPKHVYLRGAGALRPDLRDEERAGG